jgi:hypothetical protein
VIQIELVLRKFPNYVLYMNMFAAVVFVRVIITQVPLAVLAVLALHFIIVQAPADWRRKSTPKTALYLPHFRHGVLCMHFTSNPHLAKLEFTSSRTYVRNLLEQDCT